MGTNPPVIFGPGGIWKLTVGRNQPWPIGTYQVKAFSNQVEGDTHTVPFYIFATPQGGVGSGAGTSIGLVVPD